MLATKLACPHCSSILKTSKPVAEGKRITCVKCGQAFTFTSAMSVSSSGDSPKTEFMLAESQLGTSRSPVAGSAENATPSIVNVPGRRSLGWIGIVSILGLVFLIGGGAGTAYFLFALDDDESRPETVLPVTAVLQAKPEKVSEKPKQDEVKAPATLPAKVAAVPPKPKSAKTSARPIAEKKSPITLAAMTKTAPVEKSDPQQTAKAIRRGIAFLKTDIKPSGTWLKDDESLNAVGYAALPAWHCWSRMCPPAIRPFKMPPLMFANRSLR
jgi:hypothetical protein